MESLLFATAGYLIGSIPSAFLFVQKEYGVDLRRKGSGNIGARNAYEVTRNKRLGFTVLILDMLKGAVPLLVLSRAGYCEVTAVVAVSIVFGHCYPVWLNFHGGRGGAAGAAIALLSSPDTLVCWIVLYLAAGFVKKQIHIQSAVALSGCIIFVLAANNNPLFFNFRFICPGNKHAFYLSTLIILFLILLRLIQPIYALFRKVTT